MRENRKDLHKARLRRDRIRREKHAQNTPPPPPPVISHPFAAERAMREMQALLEGQNFESLDEANGRIAKLTAGGRLSETASAWMQDDPKWRAQELA